MRRRRRLNIRGKIAVGILISTMVLLIVLMIGKSEKGEARESNSSKEDNSFEVLEISSDSVLDFSETPLNQSIIKRANEEREDARKKEFTKQNKKDLYENVIYLTFDDGTSDVSEQLLDMLDEYEMKATFFLLGLKIKEQPEIAIRMKSDGHGLALHGITHDVKKIYNSYSSPTEEMKEAQSIIEGITGEHTELIRLPYGSIPYLTEEMRYILDQSEFKVWDWNVDSLDWKFKDEQYVLHTIKEIESVKQSGEAPVVLLHDKQETVQHLPKLLSYIKEQGYKTKILTNDMTPITFPCEGRCRPVN